MADSCERELPQQRKDYLVGHGSPTKFWEGRGDFKKRKIDLKLKGVGGIRAKNDQKFRAMSNCQALRSPGKEKHTRGIGRSWTRSSLKSQWGVAGEANSLGSVE